MATSIQDPNLIAKAPAATEKESEKLEQSQYQKIVDAIKNNDLKTLMENLNASNSSLIVFNPEDNISLIQRAVALGYLEIVKYLDSLIKPSNEIHTLLSQAVVSDNPEMVKYIVNTRANCFMTKANVSDTSDDITFQVLTSENEEIQEMLDTLYQFVGICKKETDSTDKKTAKDLYNMFVSKYLDAGLSFNIYDENGNNPLHLCMQAGNFILAEILLENKVDCHRWNNNFDHPLAVGIFKHRSNVPLELIDLFIQNEVTLHNFGDPEQTLMQIAAQQGNLALVKHLHEKHGISLEEELDEDQDPALICAIKSGNLELVQYIINTITEKTSETKYQLAQRYCIDDKTLLLHALENAHPHIMIYIRDNLIPLDHFEHLVREYNIVLNFLSDVKNFSELPLNNIVSDLWDKIKRCLYSIRNTISDHEKEQLLKQRLLEREEKARNELQQATSVSSPLSVVANVSPTYLPSQGLQNLVAEQTTDNNSQMQTQGTQNVVSGQPETNHSQTQMVNLSSESDNRPKLN